MPTEIPGNLAQLINSGKLDEAISTVSSTLKLPNTSFSLQELMAYVDFVCDKIEDISPMSDEALDHWMQFLVVCSERFPYSSQNGMLDFISDQGLSRLKTKSLSDENKINAIFCYFKYHKAVQKNLVGLCDSEGTTHIFTQLVRKLESNGVISSETCQQLLEARQQLLQQLLHTQKTPLESLKKLYYYRNPSNFIAMINEFLKEKMIDINLLMQLSNFLIELYDKSSLIEIQNIIDTEATINLPQRSEDLIYKKNLILQCSYTASLNSIMRQIKNGFGHISYYSSAAPFILASIRHDKSGVYSFLPTILISHNFSDKNGEFARYLNHIATMSLPVQERFILSTIHWSCGEIKIDVDGNVNLFISDSRGTDFTNFNDLAMLMSEIFINKKINIYSTFETRQYARAGCSVYALDDIRHFYTIDKYSVEEKTLFEQLDDRIIPKETKAISEKITIRCCKLPVSFMRTMQSRDLSNIISEERSRIVNKKGDTVENSIKKTFMTDAFSGALVGQNKRLDMKLEKMAKRLDDFIMKLLSDDPKQGYKKLCAMANEHTLSAFLKRVPVQKESFIPSESAQSSQFLSLENNTKIQPDVAKGREIIHTFKQKKQHDADDNKNKDAPISQPIPGNKTI